MRRSFLAGCTPNSASVLGGAVLGFLALSASGLGLTPLGILCLLGGYAAGAVLGYLLVSGLARLAGEWWSRRP